jgi:hypothetical protein
MKDLKQFERLLLDAAEQMPEITMNIIKVEGLRFIKKNFNDQGFNDSGSVNKWTPRKTTDKRSRDITRYRTNRRGKIGTLNKYGRSIQDRGLLIGEKTAGDKLINSFRAVKVSNLTIGFRTYKKYAERHNMGLDGMPKRQFIGRSAYLDRKIFEALKKQYDKRFKQ